MLCIIHFTVLHTLGSQLILEKATNQCLNQPLQILSHLKFKLFTQVKEYTTAVYGKAK